MEMSLPISRHAPGRAGHGLTQRVMWRRRQFRAVDIVVAGVVPEPVLTRLVAANHRMPGIGSVVTRVL